MRIPATPAWRNCCIGRSSACSPPSLSSPGRCRISAATPSPDTLINLHLSFGVLILAVAVVRLDWRMPHTEPPPEDGLPPWQMQSARVAHWLLYVLLFVVPILGWINASWRGFPITLFGLLEMPKLVATRMPGFGWTGDVHNALANYAMLALIGLHVVAALYHHFVRRDRVLQRMLPGH